MAYRVQTGFRSIHHALLFAVGAWSFHYQLTRLRPADQNPWFIGASVVLMAAPSVFSAYRAVNNAMLGVPGRVLRKMEEAEEEGDPP